MIHTLPWTFEEIGASQNKLLGVVLECHVTPGSAGSYWEPPCSPQVEFGDATIVELEGEHGSVLPSSSWAPLLVGVALKLAEENRDCIKEELLEQITNYEDSAREEYYDQKREELRSY